MFINKFLKLVICGTSKSEQKKNNLCHIKINGGKIACNEEGKTDNETPVRLSLQ